MLTQAREPFTIRRLRAIKRGEMIVYYKGRLPHDVEDSRQYGSFEAAALIERICECACQLKILGQVTMHERRIHLPPNPKMVYYYMEIIEYSVTGT